MRRLTVRETLERPALLDEGVERVHERRLAEHEAWVDQESAEQEAREPREDPDYRAWLTRIEPDDFAA